jgi:glycosyltransferase involved in cell wall biosynthesis
VVVLRPAIDPDGRKVIVVGDGTAGGYPNLRYRLPEDKTALQRFLKACDIETAEIHHFLNHPPAIHDVIASLRCPVDVHVHDYAWFCPRIALVGSNDRYCGEPDLAACEACVTVNGSLLGEDIGPSALRRRSEALFRRAARIITPSLDAAHRIRRHFADIRVSAQPPSGEAVVAPAPAVAHRRSLGRIRVCVVGAIGVHKGYDVLLDCARDAAERKLDLDFILVGHSIDDHRLLSTERVSITGGYEQEEVVSLIQSQSVSLGWIPSIWPETWCMTLTEMWQTGLNVAAFDIGAPAERIRRTGRGLLLPLGISATTINTALLHAAGRSFAH